MKKRRFHITEDEGNTVIMGLICGIEEVNKIIEKEPTPYWKLILHKMQTLKYKIQTYKWEVEE